MLSRLLPRTRPQRLLLFSSSAFALSYLYTTPSTTTTSTSSIFKLGNSFSSSSKMSSGKHIKAEDYPKGKSETEWQAQLSSEQFRILRKKGTEMAGSGKLDQHFAEKGVYECAGCGTPLYTADTKFKSGCGWPAFFDAIPGAVTRHVDSSWGMERTEIVCSSCGGHLGHIFKGEGFDTPTDERACVNSVSIRFNDKIEGTYKNPPKI